jgi:membrane protease YdiL (CAAX protease family)
MTDERTKFASSNVARPILAFIALAFGITWLIWLPLVIGADGLHLLKYSPDLPIWASVGAFGPLIAAIVISRRQTGDWLPSRIFPPPKPASLFHLLTSPALILLGFVGIPFVCLTQVGSRHPHWSALLPLLSFWPNLFGGPFEEEFGWRGFLLPKLTTRFGPTPAALLVALIWSSWHLPLFFVHSWGSVPFWFYLALVSSLSVIITFGYNLTGGSIFAAILAHFTFNECSEIVENLLKDSHLQPSANLALTILLVMIGTGLILIVSTKGRLGLAKTQPIPQYDRATA